MFNSSKMLLMLAGGRAMKKIKMNKIRYSWEDTCKHVIAKQCSQGFRRGAYFQGGKAARGQHSLGAGVPAELGSGTFLLDKRARRERRTFQAEVTMYERE